MASNFYFNLNKALISDAFLLLQFPFFKILPILKKILSFLLFIFFVLIFFSLITTLPFPQFPGRLFAKKFFGAFLFTFPLFFSILVLEGFLNYFKNPKIKIKIQQAIAEPEKYNLAEFLSFESAQIINFAQNFSKQKKLPLNSTLLLFSFLTLKRELDEILIRLLLDKRKILEILKRYLEILKGETKITEDFKDAILTALKEAEKVKHEKIEIEDLFLGIIKANVLFKDILIQCGIQIEDVETLIWWYREIKTKIEEKKKWWAEHNLRKLGSIGKELTAGYTITLDKFSIDLTKEVQRMGEQEIVGHQKEIEEVERILARREARNDPLLIGEAGSGRRSIVWAIAKKSLKGESLPEINYKRIVQLNLTSLLSQLESLEAVEATLDTIFKEVIAAKNVILVIDEFHNFVGSKFARPGTIDISGILAPYISSPDFQLIAITTFEGFHRNIEPNPSLISFFEKVEVSEISKEETLKLLQRLTMKLEQKYKILISYLALKDVMKYSEKYLPAAPFPEKALNLLEEVVVHLAQKREKIVLPKHIAQIITQKIQVPVGEIEEREKDLLLNLEKLFHERVINQEEAIKEVSAALRRARAEVGIRKGPIGCFLFLGPTGVGKTETAKALAEIYFGSERRMIRLDMSEFQNITDIPRLLGSLEEPGLLTTPVRENPFSLILLDEFEKAHSQVLNLFLQVFDEGHLTDGLGRKVDFKNTIIICTSNAGYQLIFKAAKEGRDWKKTKEEVINFLIENGIFRPELLNRFDAVVLYQPLSKENLIAIADLMLKRLQKQLKEKQIEFQITQALKEKIVELSYTPEFGARQMQRIIQEKVSNVLAEAILKNEIKRGERIEIDPQNFAIIKK